MKRSKTYTIVSLALSAILLFSSFSFAFDMHYCQGKMQDMALFGKAKTCSPDDLRKPACQHHENEHKAIHSFEKQPCCKHASQLWQLDTDYQPGARIHLQHSVAVLPAFRALEVKQTWAQTGNFVPNYRPPPAISDRCTWFQVFLI